MRLINADKYMERLRADIDSEADIIAEYIKRDTPIGTVKDGGRIGRLQGVQWCRSVLELDYYTVKAIPLDEYESRLKADMVAMLKEIQLEIEENSYSENVYGDEYGINKVISTDDIYQIIQQKIDKCKAESENT